LIFMARGDHGVAVVKFLYVTVVVAAHAAGVSKPVMRSEAFKNRTSDAEVHTHRHQMGSTEELSGSNDAINKIAGSSYLTMQNGWAKAQMPNGNVRNYTHDHARDAAGLLESTNAIDTIEEASNSQARNKAPEGPITKVVYAAGNNDNIKTHNPGTIDVMPGIKYRVAMEALQNDLGQPSEYVMDVTLDGVSMGGCKPTGGDYDCTFFKCPLSGVKEVVSGSGKIIVDMKYTGHSWDCDCDMQSWKCSAEKGHPGYVAGRHAMTAVMRFTLMPQTTAPTPEPTAEPTFTPLLEAEKATFDGGLAKYDKDGDLKVTWEEAKAGGLTKAEFDSMDVDGDGVLTAEDYTEAKGTNSTGGAWDKFLAQGLEGGAYRSAEVSAISVLVFVLLSLRM